jgi:FtsZ-interacting cell division protein ZipA
MNTTYAILADSLIPTDVLPGSRQWLGLSFKELMIVLGALAIVTLIVFIWAAYIRKPARHRSHHHHHHHHSSGEESDAEGYLATDSAEGENGRRYRRKRRRRREHRPRNPTLAETGGLPPLRADQPPDPLP